MEITTQVTTEKKIQIELPFFRKDSTFNSTKLMGVINEKTVCSLFISPERTHVSVDSIELMWRETAKAYSDWTPISETEFLEAHKAALKSLSLVPELVDDPANDLKDVL